MTRSLFCFAALLALAGCSADGRPGPVASVPTMTDDLPIGTIGRERRDDILPAQAALLTLPGFQAARVGERAYGDGVVQQIEIAGPAPHGINLLEVAVRSTPVATAGAQIPLAKPTEAGIRSEILSRFPDTSMQIVPKPLANRFGPFGLAIGRNADATRCLFAWQWIDGLGEDAMPASVRLRLCRQGMTVDDLARAMQGLAIGDRQAFDRLHEPRVIADPTPTAQPPSAWGIVANGGTLEQTLGAAPPARTPRPAVAPRKRVGSTRRAPEPEVAPLEPFSGPYLAPVKQGHNSSMQQAHKSTVAKAKPTTTTPARTMRPPAIAAALPAQ